jgi:putative ABC transport system permease protein
VAEGQRITHAHVEGYQAVALLGTDVAEYLFNSRTNLVGQKVRLQGQIFEVVGVLEEQGGTGFQNDDNRVIVPLSTAQQRLLTRPFPDQVDLIYVQAGSSETVTSTIDDVTQILRARHTKSLGEDDFDILNTQSFLETATAITGTMTLFLGGIAGISLLVGGIGIMNIMLVAVSERTREVGLRKALGARKNDIRIQFLVEAALLSMGGGMIGIALGWGIAILVGRIAQASGNTLNPQVEMNAVLLATIFSTAVGLFFGIYPANRAAGLEPVEALRSE